MSISNDIFVSVAAENRLHRQFRDLRDSPFHSEARLLINTLYQRMGLHGKDFIRKFQTDGFHSHLFEIACFAYLESGGFVPNRTYSSPDFLASRDGFSLAIEVTTSNPSEDQSADISLRMLADLSEDEIAAKVNVEFPNRMISILKKKVNRQYDKLPQCAGKPLVLMVAPFFEAGSIHYTDDALVDCLYGIRETTTGFFSLQSSKSVSAVLYCNAFTVPRFFRLATPLECNEELTAMREGMYYAVRSETELSVKEFRYRVGSQSAPRESWSEGVTLFLNPNALIPISKEVLPSTSSFSIQDGYLVREVYGFHPVTSNMYVYANDVAMKMNIEREIP